MKEGAPEVDVTNVPDENQGEFIAQAAAAEACGNIAKKSEKNAMKEARVEDAGKLVKKFGVASGLGLIGVLPPAAIPLGGAAFLAGAAMEAHGVDKEFALRDSKDASRDEQVALQNARALTTSEPDIDAARAEMESVLANKEEPPESLGEKIRRFFGKAK